MNDKVFKIFLITTFILLIPLIAMQFTEEVGWSLSDFIIAGVLLFGTGVLINYTLKKLKHKPSRIIAIIVILLILLLVWIEMAVGIFGSPFAGS